MCSKSREGKARNTLLLTSMKVSLRTRDFRTVCQGRQLGRQVCAQELRGLTSSSQHLILSTQPTWYGLGNRALGIKYSKSSLKVIDGFLELQRNDV